MSVDGCGRDFLSVSGSLFFQQKESWLISEIDQVDNLMSKASAINNAARQAIDRRPVKGPASSTNYATSLNITNAINVMKNTNGIVER